METAASPDDLKAVRKLYEEAARTDASNPDLWYSIGRCDLRLGRAATAIADLERALVLSPQHMGALHQLERALRAAGRKSDADRVGRVFRTRAFHDREESRLEDYIARAPQDWDAKARLTELYLESGKRGLAALVYRQLKEGRPDDPRLPAFTRALNPPTVPALPPHLMDGGAAAPSTE